jgi:hypothetical protein
VSLLEVPQLPLLAAGHVRPDEHSDRDLARSHAPADGVLQHDDAVHCAGKALARRIRDFALDAFSGRLVHDSASGELLR